MARTAEVVRQWQLLQALDGAPHGLTIRRMASVGGCSTRTIRRDLSALERAGFPLYDEKIDGTARWRLERNPLKGLDAGFRLTELCALYFSRALLEALVGSPFHADVQSAFARFEQAMPARMKTFLDRLPAVMKAKPARMKLRSGSDPRGERTARVMDAVLNQREIRMRYASASSRRTRDYVVHPYRIVYAEGGLYLIAFVPDYAETRTFALERIESAALLDTKFTPHEPLATDVFPHSLGVNTGPPERIAIEFDAPALRARARMAPLTTPARSA
jgi:predicted DNA-binding transcriptional regulator YafY